MRYYMYHPDQAPDGKIFDSETTPAESLGEKWVDNPAKFGHSATGQADPAYLAREKARHESTETVPEGEQSRVDLLAEIAALRKRDEEREEYLASLREEPSLARRMEQDREQTADEVADAVRGRAKGEVANTGAAETGAATGFDASSGDTITIEKPRLGVRPGPGADPGAADPSGSGFAGDEFDKMFPDAAQ